MGLANPILVQSSLSDQSGPRGHVDTNKPIFQSAYAHMPHAPIWPKNQFSGILGHVAYGHMHYERQVYRCLHAPLDLNSHSYIIMITDLTFGRKKLMTPSLIESFNIKINVNINTHPAPPPPSPNPSTSYSPPPPLPLHRGGLVPGS